MHRHFKPAGKQRVMHYFKRPAMDAAHEWDINTHDPDDTCKELQDESEKLFCFK